MIKYFHVKKIFYKRIILLIKLQILQEAMKDKKQEPLSMNNVLLNGQLYLYEDKTEILV